VQRQAVKLRVQYIAAFFYKPLFSTLLSLQNRRLDQDKSMKNFLKVIAVTTMSASFLAIVGCANPKVTQAQAEAAIPESSQVTPAGLKPIYSIAAPGAAQLNKFAYFYDQDRGDSFFITAPAAKTLFQIGADEGQLMQSITKTVKLPMSDNIWVQETDGTLFMLNGANELQVLGVDVFPKSFGIQKLPGLVNPKSMAVSKLSPGYRIAVIDQLPTGDKLKLFRADLKSKTVFDVGDLELLTITVAREVDLGASSITSMNGNPIEAGFILTQGQKLRFLNNDGQFTDQAPIQLNKDTRSIDVMPCNRGMDKGYWIALQQTETGFQIELLRRLSFESLGAVNLDGVKSVTDMRFMGRPTKYLPNGGVFIVADGKLAAYNWHDIAAALGAREKCF
jgi:hypothetical protein